MNLRYAYNTNGAANHRLADALEIISDHGYDGVALTLDHHHFDPFEDAFEKRAEKLSAKLEKLNLSLVIETGARFLLDPREKHEPTLLTPTLEGRKKRVDFLKRAVDLAQIARAEAVSFWAGVKKDSVSGENAQRYFRDGVREISEYAESRNVVLALEPEPGMLIETVKDFQKISEEFPALKIALDTGHCLASNEGDPAQAIVEMREKIGTVAIEDMRRGVHEHLYFGEGEMNIPQILSALKNIEFKKLICVELSRHSHCADKIVPAAIEYLREAEKNLTEQIKENAAAK